EKAQREFTYLPEYGYEAAGELSVPFEPELTPDWVRQTVTWYISGLPVVERERSEAAYAKRELERKKASADPLSVAVTSEEITELKRMITGRRRDQLPKLKR